MLSLHSNYSGELSEARMDDLRVAEEGYNLKCLENRAHALNCMLTSPTRL